MKNKTNKRKNRKQFLNQKTTIKLDWYELLDLKYVLRDYLCNKFKGINEMVRLQIIENDSIDSLLITEEKMIKLYKEVIKKIDNYD